MGEGLVPPVTEQTRWEEMSGRVCLSYSLGKKPDGYATITDSRQKGFDIRSD